MPKLDTWGFLKKLATHTVAGDPLAIVDDIAESAQEDAKDKKKDKDAIDTTGETSGDD
jgi:hypothetical protein